MKGTTRPQGTTSCKDTAFGIIPRLELLRLEIEGTKKGLGYLYDLIRREKKTQVTPELIAKLHKVSFGWIFPKWAGKYRTIQVTFSGKEAPPYYQLPELVFNLCQDTEKRIVSLPKPDDEDFILKVVSFLAWFQHRFVFIHPFKDYNGRTARMLTILVLLRLNLPPFELKADTKEDRTRYLSALQKADKGDFSFLEKLIGKALSDNLIQIQK